MIKSFIQLLINSWNFLILFVKKKEKKKWQMCINYHALNDLTVKNKYSLSQIQECLNCIRKVKYKTKLDFFFDYWQVWVTEKNIAKTVFNTQQEKYEFLIMFFSLTNTSTIFQEMMNDILLLWVRPVTSVLTVTHNCTHRILLRMFKTLDDWAT